MSGAQHVIYAKHKTLVKVSVKDISVPLYYGKQKVKSGGALPLPKSAYESKELLKVIFDQIDVKKKGYVSKEYMKWNSWKAKEEHALAALNMDRYVHSTL